MFKNVRECSKKRFQGAVHEFSKKDFKGLFMNLVKKILGGCS